MIYEAVVITRNEDDSLHIVPLGYQRHQECVVLAPFKPSTTLLNLERRRDAVLNFTDDVRIIAGCLTGRREWPTVRTEHVDGARLADTLGHQELRVERIEDDPQRPRAYCEILNTEIHKPFPGFNRAQAACLEAAILVSRLTMLPAEKVDRDLAYLQIAVDKTAGEREREAWSWLLGAVASFRQRAAEEGGR